MVDIEQEIISLTEQLLRAISRWDYATYSQLVDPNVTSFEPEALGHLVSGLEFHKFYFDNLAGKVPAHLNTTMIHPKVHVLGNDAATIAYIRLTQFIDSKGQPHSQKSEETRIWHLRDGKWQMVHFHRSNPTI